MTDVLDAAIAARLRVESENYRNLAVEQQTKWATRCTTAESEVVRLRAELAAAQKELKDMELRETLLQKSLIAARHHITELGDAIASLRADLAEALKAFP